MKLVVWLAVIALPGSVVLALAALGMRVSPGWDHLLGLVAFSSMLVTYGVGLLVWIVDKVKASAQTARLRTLLGVACAMSIALALTAASLAFADGCSDVPYVYFVWLPIPLAAAAVLGRRSLRNPP